MGIDYVRRTATFERVDGKQATFPLDSDGAGTGSIREAWFGTSSTDILIRTTAGDDVVLRGEDRRPDVVKPVVYLDQNHWSTISKAIHAPERVKAPGECAAALAIARLALRGHVALPMSAGHMYETTKWTADLDRYRLALTLLQLGGGWIMDDPLAVRRVEISAALGQRYHGATPPKFTPFGHDWSRLFAAERAPTAPTAPTDFGRIEQAQFVRWTSVVGIAATLLDDDPIEPAQSTGWAESMQRFTDWLATEQTEQPLRIARTDLAFLADMSTTIAEEAHALRLSIDDLHDWNLHHHGEDVDRSPMLGLFREAMRQKLATSTTTWTQNDLTDLMYLSCGAGYADVVVGERQLVGQLNGGAQRLRRSLRAFRRLQDALPTILDLVGDLSVGPGSKRSDSEGQADAG
ncbi:MAG: hypothetical protein ACE37B_06880 [Ilumatobacter sp.]|uniref:hypothetical protein n=1 Tax=Ilumatobacter sp. TaxID=1967498 RepID=UPI00391CFCF3